MISFKRISFLILIIMFTPHLLSAASRVLPDEITTKNLTINFNGETLKGIYSLTDARTEDEKRNDIKEGHTAGAVIVFLNGHAQRPLDANKFINDLAIKSKSGIVVTPICDTPYGKNSLWHGDNGKDIVLMEMVRHILGEINISLKNYVAIFGNTVTTDITESSHADTKLSTELIVIGWSHGGLLSRRLASTYPEIVIGMGQVCPAGYKDWAAGFPSLALAFTGESLNIGKLLFTKNVTDATRAGYGFTTGIISDFSRGIGPSITSLNPMKLFRPFKDMRDCSIYADNFNYPVKSIKNGVVIFAVDDTVMDTEQSGITGNKQPSVEENKKFWDKFYPEIHLQGGNYTLKFLKGNHLAPIVHHDLYSTVLLNELKETVN